MRKNYRYFFITFRYFLCNLKFGIIYSISSFCGVNVPNLSCIVDNSCKINFWKQGLYSPASDFSLIWLKLYDYYWVIWFFSSGWNHMIIVDLVIFSSIFFNLITYAESNSFWKKNNEVVQSFYEKLAEWRQNIKKIFILNWRKI